MEVKKYSLFSCILILLSIYVAVGIGSFLVIFIFPIFHSILPSNLSLDPIFLCLAACLILTLFFVLVRKGKRYNPVIHKINIVYIMIICLMQTIGFVLTNGSLLSPLSTSGLYPVLIMFPLILILSLYGTYTAIIGIGLILLFSLILSTLSLHNRKHFIFPIVFIGCSFLCGFTFLNSPNYKYRNQSHGFKYMDGFSSTDFSDYHVYSNNSKLVSLDHEPEFMIENPEDMPVMDGAEATYPLYAAVAKTLYKNIDEIELNFKQNGFDPDYGTSNNGTIVTFYNTAVGFERLVAGDVDLFFGAKPSASQLEYAKEKGVELNYTPIGKEAFVFFVEEDNPVDSMTSDQIKSIYHGDITNWKKLGGNDEKIIAFQRPERSGSQSMMVYFMGDVSLKEPLTHEMEHSMMGIIENVVEYQNEAGAIGYSFRYFLEGLNEVDNVKMIEVDGVYPSNETIQNGTYPLVTTLYCITVKDNDNPYVQKVLDFLLSEDGQSLIEMTGYSPLN